MASIRNSISMVDRMTPTLRSILKSMDSTLRVMKQLDKAANKGVQSKAYQQAEKDIKRANNQLIQMRNQAILAAQGAGDVADSWDKVNKSVNKSKMSVGSFFQSAAAGIYTLKQGLQAVSKMMNISDSGVSDVAKLGLFNTSGSSNMAVYAQAYKTAQASRSGLSDTAALAQRIMLSGVYQGEGATKGALDLAGTINKAMVLGGGTSEENSRTILQLSQALSSGQLQGDELRSLREQSPYLAKMLAEGLGKVDDKFIGTTIGDLKSLGEQGELTSAVVVKALQAMSVQIGESFDANAPKTFSGALQSVGNTIQFLVAIMSTAEGPIGRITQALWDLADWLGTPQGFQFLSTLQPMINLVAFAFQGLSAAIQFVGNNISWIAPIFGTLLALLAAYNAYLAISKGITIATGIAQGIAAVAAYAKAKADERAALAAAANGSAAAASAAVMMANAAATASATAAQHGFNAALWASPITWIIAIIIILIGLVFLVVSIINKATGSSVSAIGIIVGALTTAIAFLWNLFLGFLDLVLACVNYMVNPWISFANFIGNLFNDPIGAVIHLFGDMADRVLGLLESVAKAIDKVFGSNLAGTVSGWREGLADMVERAATKYGNGSYEKIMDELNLSSESLGLSRWSYGDAWDSGYNFGADLQNQLSEFGNFDDALAGIQPVEAEVTGGTLDGIKEDVNLGDEDIKLLRDMAARDYLLQLQSITPVANVTFGDVRETADVKKIVAVIEQMVEEQMATSLVS